MCNFKIDLCLATKNSIVKLPNLIKSINKQTYKGAVNLLVADNNSNDGTLNELNYMKIAKVISYRDNSPEEGFNNLLIQDRKNLKIIISSDDYLSENYLEEFSKEAKYLIKKKIKKFILLPIFYKKFGAGLFNINFPLPIYFLNFMGISRGIGFGIYNHTGNIPKFNENIKYASDFELLIRCLKNGYYFKYVSCKYYYSKEGRSAQNWLEAINEERLISLKYNKNIFIRILINIIFKVKYTYKIINTY
tara:strand:+ start:1448 stop:2191 length:744 start_codon:yes stop_codon:yes gene_type:complete